MDVALFIVTRLLLVDSKANILFILIKISFWLSADCLEPSMCNYGVQGEEIVFDAHELVT
jgi:hypothetical protein